MQLPLKSNEKVLVYFVLFFSPYLGSNELVNIPLKINQLICKSLNLNRYEQSDGVVRSEEGIIKNAGTEQEALEVRGSITWTAADGEVYTLNFVADENGYRPEGAHIPHL